MRDVRGCSVIDRRWKINNSGLFAQFGTAE
jgi:hypothetical protein